MSENGSSCDETDFVSPGPFAPVVRALTAEDIAVHSAKDSNPGELPLLLSWVSSTTRRAAHGNPELTATAYNNVFRLREIMNAKVAIIAGLVQKLEEAQAGEPPRADEPKAKKVRLTQSELHANAIQWLNTVVIKVNAENMVQLSQVVSDNFEILLAKANHMHSQIEASKKASLPIYVALGKCLQKCFEAKGGRVTLIEVFQQHHKKADLPEDQSFSLSWHTAKKHQLLYKLSLLLPNFSHVSLPYAQLSHLPLAALIEYGDYDKSRWVNMSSSSSTL